MSANTKEKKNGYRTDTSDSVLGYVSGRSGVCSTGAGSKCVDELKTSVEIIFQLEINIQIILGNIGKSLGKI